MPNSFLTFSKFKWLLAEAEVVIVSDNNGLHLDEVFVKRLFLCLILGTCISELRALMVIGVAIEVC